MDKPLIIMLMGLPGCGKSNYANSITIEKEIDDGPIEVIEPVIHSSDALRRELYGSECTQGNNEELFQELHKRIKADLSKGIDVIYDATNIHKKQRISFLKELKKIPCHPICFCMVVPYDICLQQNEKRERKVPVEVIRKMYMNWCPPDYTEGFERIKLVVDYGSPDGSLQYTTPHIFKQDSGIYLYDQGNKHHSLTLGEHCKKAAEYVQEHWPDNKLLCFAALYHDIGKPFTRTETNSKGEVDGNAHYYQHQCVGAYDSILYTNTAPLTEDDILYISNLIYYHMRPLTAWAQSKKAEERDMEAMGVQMYRDVKRLHEADMAAT